MVDSRTRVGKYKINLKHPVVLESKEHKKIKGWGLVKEEQK